MILKFRYGFAYKNVTFGWLNKELYKLPHETNRRFYPLRKTTSKVFGNQPYYRCMRDWISQRIAESLTHSIDVNIDKITDKNCPF